MQSTEITAYKSNSKTVGSKRGKDVHKRKDEVARIAGRGAKPLRNCLLVGGIHVATWTLASGAPVELCSLLKTSVEISLVRTP